MDAGIEPPSGGTDGRVERLDELFGVGGWAYDRAAPERALTVELWAGERLIATVETGGARPDVCAAHGVTATPGFSFEDDVRDAIRAAAAEGLTGELAVRIAGSDANVPSVTVARSLEDIRRAGGDGMPAHGDALLDRLSVHSQTAQGAIDQSLRPLPGKAIGFIEAISIDDAGLTWVVGWMQEDALRDRPVVVLDNGKYAGGFAYALFTRDDLPPGSKGYIGVLHTAWRASPDLAPFLFLADGSLRFLESLQPTPIRTRQAFAPLARDLLARSEDGYGEILRDLFHTVHSWSLEDVRNPADMVRIDELAILPGFGAFAKGWALSPSKDADRFVLKAGNRIVVAEPRSIARHERADLASVYPNVGQALATAGFVATFRGSFDEVRTDEMILKATWHDGSSTNQAVAPTVVRILGLTAPLDSARRFYPALEAEGFFADFAAHAARQTQVRAQAVQPYEVRAATGVIVMAAPATASDLFLAIDRAIRHADALPNDWGIAIVAQDDQRRALLLSLFADLKRATGRPCSLFLTRAVAPTTDTLPAVLDAVGATRFAFAAADVLLTAEGWHALSDADELTLLGVDDPTAPAAPSHADLSAFAADRATWDRLSARAAPRIGGIALAPGTAHRVIAHGAVSLGSRRQPPLVQRINQATGTHHG